MTVRQVIRTDPKGRGNPIDKPLGCLTLAADSGAEEFHTVQFGFSTMYQSSQVPLSVYTPNCPLPS